MSCYHPLIAAPSGEKTKLGKDKYKILGAAEDFEEIRRNEVGILIPCGKCIGCRLDYSRRWADRMMLELETAGCGVFLTLTYDNDNILWLDDNESGEKVGTLVKRDCQLFMKRLRKYYGDLSIRFFLAGEYGDKTKRPHYHCIFFGVSLINIGDCIYFGKNELGQNYYTSENLTRIWSKGHVLVANVSWQTCAYVARYILSIIGVNGVCNLTTHEVFILNVSPGKTSST